MLYRVFDAAELPALVSAFMDSYEVVAPVKRGAHYSFEAISSPEEMDLAYDTTLASPKRYFLAAARDAYALRRRQQRGG